MFRFKKIILALLVLFSIQYSYAFDECTIEGDFVPWPWSEEYYSLVLNQNWILIDQDGIPQSELIITRPTFYWGFRNDVYIITENAINSVNMKWGMSRISPDNTTSEQIVFNVWDESNYPAKRQSYEVQIGYWMSSRNQVTLDEESLFRDSLFQNPFSPNPRKICSTFRHRKDHVMGLRINIETETVDGIQTRVMYGLTRDPIYIQD